MRKYGESKTPRIMMVTVPHVTSGLGLIKFQADGFLLTRVHSYIGTRFIMNIPTISAEDYLTGQYSPASPYLPPLISTRSCCHCSPTALKILILMLTFLTQCTKGFVTYFTTVNKFNWFLYVTLVSEHSFKVISSRPCLIMICTRDCNCLFQNSTV